MIHGSGVLSFTFNINTNYKYMNSLKSRITFLLRTPSSVCLSADSNQITAATADITEEISSASTSTSASASASARSITAISISRPIIHWTVPEFKVGWQDENGNWFDEDGPRNGPPQNFWRQMSDEREYKMDMDALDAVMAMGTNSHNHKEMIEDAVAQLEKRRSVRYPSLSRKMLGRWVPILLSGQRVTYDDRPTNDNNMDDILAPFVLEIHRTNGRLYGPKNHYGIFDKKLSCGEELTFNVLNGMSGDCSCCGSEEGGELIISSASIVADDNNEPMLFANLLDNIPLYYGGITYVTDYIMIQRRGQEIGEIDFWLRADDSYLGVTDPNVGMGEIKVE